MTASLYGVQAVKPEEVADLIRRVTESQHDLATMRARLEEAGGPLAVVASALCVAVEGEFDQAAESLKAAASAITMVMIG